MVDRTNSRESSNRFDGRSDTGPHFVCIGPANSATTWLADQLKLYPDIWLPPIQELTYLTSGFSRYKGTDDLELLWDWWSVVKRLVRNKSLSSWRDVEFLSAARELAEKPDSELDLPGYRKLFEPAHGKITGDISPVYAIMPEERLKRLGPVLRGRRVFMIARDPIQRFWSAMSMYWRLKTYGERDYGSLETAKLLFSDPVRSRQHRPSQVLARWNEGLAPDRLDVFFFDEIAERPTKALTSIVSYLGADPKKRIGIVPAGLNRKKRLPKPAISREAREWVREAFQEELQSCARVFGAYGHRWLDRHRS